MKTIREVFSYNLRLIRGDKTQSAFAEALGVPLSTLQKMEAGNVPQKAKLTSLAASLGVPETALFLDPDLIRPSLDEALKVLTAHLGYEPPKKKQG